MAVLMLGLLLTLASTIVVTSKHLIKLLYAYKCPFFTLVRLIGRISGYLVKLLYVYKWFTSRLFNDYKRTHYYLFYKPKRR